MDLTSKDYQKSLMIKIQKPVREGKFSRVFHRGPSIVFPVKKVFNSFFFAGGEGQSMAVKKLNINEFLIKGTFSGVQASRVGEFRERQ